MKNGSTLLRFTILATAIFAGATLFVSDEKFSTAANPSRRPVRRKQSVAFAKANLREGSLYDRIKHLCGVASGPGDLSTNPKYMEGYGQSRRP